MLKKLESRRNKSQSPLEDRLASAFDDFNLPYIQQYSIHVFFADFCFPDKMLVVEVDGQYWHNTDRDAYRDRRMEELGWKVERYPGWFVYRYPEVIASKIAYQYFGIDTEQVRGAIAMYDLFNHQERSAIAIATGK